MQQLIALGILVASAQAQPEFRLDVIGSWGGGYHDVEIVERTGRTLAFAAVHRRLEILDATDATKLEVLGTLDLVARVLDVAVAGDLVYCATDGEPYGFCVVDASDPTRPELAFANQHSKRVLHGLEIWPSHPAEVDLWGDYAFVDGMHSVFDLSDPMRPVHLGPALSGQPRIEIVGDLVFAAHSHPDLGLSVYRLDADPLSPTLISRLTFDGAIERLTLDGAFACVLVRPSTGDPHYVQVVDVADPANPLARGRIEDHVKRGPMVLDQGVLALTDTAGGSPRAGGIPSDWEVARGLRLFDVSTNPDAPRLVSEFKPRDIPVPVYAQGGTLWLRSAEGLILLDVSDPSDPTVITRLFSTSPNFLAVDGDDVFASDPTTGVTWLDWSADDNPEVQAVFRTPGVDGTAATGGLQEHGGLHLAEKQLAFAAGYNGLYLLDTHGPSEFAPIFSLPYPDCARAESIERVGTRLHVGTAVCGGLGWLVEYTIDHASRVIREHGFYEIGMPPERIRSDGAGLTYAVVTSRGLVFDTRDPDDPILLSDAPVGGNDLWLEDARIWITNPGRHAEQGLYAYDVSAPRAPALVSHIPIDWCSGLAVDDEGRLWTAGRTGGVIPGSTYSESLSAFDISDPANPRLLAQGRGASREPRLAFANGRILEVNSGITAYRLRCLADTDGDGAVTVNDYFRFLHAFEVGDLMIADCDFDKLLTLFDFLCYQNAWTRGCP